MGPVFETLSSYLMVNWKKEGLHWNSTPWNLKHDVFAFTEDMKAFNGAQNLMDLKLANL